MLKNFIVNIEIVGTCNLRCPSCPVGNYGENRSAGSIGGTMSVEHFKEIILKIKKEYHGRSQDVFIALYSWGEPLIHPKIDKLITVAHEVGFRVGLSSNLNYERNLARAIEAYPDEFVVSLSGFSQEEYSKSHAGGNIEKVKDNMHLLSKLVADNGHRTKVLVHYHCYKHNTGSDVREMAKLCEALKLEFMPSIAYYMPVENLLRFSEDQLNHKDGETIARLLVPLKEQLKISSSKADTSSCELLDHRLDIDVDGAVKLCCATYDRANNVTNNFLTNSFEEIQTLRKVATICGPCMTKGINRIYLRKDYDTWCNLANDQLQSLGRLIKFSTSGYEIIDFKNEATLLAKALTALSKGDLDEAEKEKSQLDAEIEKKYGQTASKIQFIKQRLKTNYWRRGSTIPIDPLQFFFIEAVLLRNNRNSAIKSKDLLIEMRLLAGLLATDASYAQQVEVMTSIIDEWINLAI